MAQRIFIFLFLLVGFSSFSQKNSKEFRSKKIEVKRDTIQVDSLSINPQYFKVFSSEGKLVSKQNYSINFSKAELILNKNIYPKITVEYLRYPSFLTKTYSPFNKSLIVPNTSNTGKLYSATTNRKKDFKLFYGLKPKGFIARGITTGNNQNMVTNSSLDLTLEGKLSSKVSIKANIFDTNFPLQQNGYSQNITNFDRIFVELYSKNWRIKGGDLSLHNSDSYFLNFEKQVAGIEVEANITKKAKALASGAIVRGRFSVFNFVGIEGNQGPYKILGAKNESVIIIVSGSDKVFVNGTQLQRGETKDYVIDYNLAEIRFNTTYPITNDMRIRVEFQYSDRNYTRFVTYEKAQYKADKFEISGYFYNENDAKNQPIQQKLTDSQKQILENSGNDNSKMVAESAYLDTYDANRIQYKKKNNYFEYSTNKNDELYTVLFTNVGGKQGDYSVSKTIATGTIYKFVGKNQGNYNPVVRLIAPSKLQVAVVNSSYKPSEKTKINTELAFSNNDLNLFSSIGDEKNKRIATKVNWKQILIDKKWTLASNVNYKFIQDNFKTVQRFRAVEFNRDWNLVNPTGNQQEIGATFMLKNKKNDSISYGFNHLRFTNTFIGSKHNIESKLIFHKTSFSINGSILNNSSSKNKDTFFRLNSKVEHSFGRRWLGTFFNTENNRRRNKNTAVLSKLSFKFKEYGAYFGVGDTTKVFAKIGFNYRTNDSIRNNKFSQINNRKTLYVNSKLIQNKHTNLLVYANYQFTNNMFAENQKTLNSKLIYNQRFFNNFLRLGAVYETSSGATSRQDYVYVKTEPGQGFYTWIDYNNDGVQQFSEFEVAQFQDQADYLRMALPNLKYIPTQRVKWKQSLTLNASQWANRLGIKKIISHFYNQTYLLVDNEQQRIGNTFNFNPFNFDKNKLLGLSFNFRNSTYFNRNLQAYSCIYTFGKSRNKQQFNIGSQESNSFIHQIEFQHKLTSFWLFDFLVANSENKLATENLANRNYRLQISEVHPKLTFLYDKNHRLSLFYQLKQKENRLKEFEKLHQQKIGASYFFISKKQNQISASINMFLNKFTGKSNSPVGYQMLEGLQTGKNYTWNLLFNQKINSLLNINLSYFGRKSENLRTIHTGTVQLKAVF